MELERLKELCEKEKANTKAQFGFECGYATLYTQSCGECIFGRQMTTIMRNNSSKQKEIEK